MNISINAYNHIYIPLISDIADYNKDIHSAKCKGEVMSSCNVNVIENEREKKRIVCVLKGTLSAHALNHVSLFVILRLA